jgi:biotin carboxyl carrier protein
MTFEVDIGGRVRRVIIEPAGPTSPAGGRFRVRLRPPGDMEGDPSSATATADETFEVDGRLTDLGICLVESASGRVVDVAMTERGAGEWLLQFSSGHVTAIVDGRLGRRGGDAAGPTGAQRLTAPMPGRVVRVLVRPGDEVRARQGLVVIEAMKMENELTATRAGRVREVTVAAGAAVEAGRLLVVIE